MNTLLTELRQYLGHAGKWRDEYAVSILKTGSATGSRVLKTTVFLISLREMMTYSMICDLFHFFHQEIMREKVLNERIPMVIVHDFVCLYGAL